MDVAGWALPTIEIRQIGHLWMSNQLDFRAVVTPRPKVK
jgi:hypothetical protein